MEPTPMTLRHEEAFPELLMRVARTLEGVPSWVIFSHQKLDGDALGTATALFEAGVLLGKRVRWVGPDPVPPAYNFLPHAGDYEMRKEFRFDGEDIYIFLDSANEERGVKGLDSKTPKAVVVNIDHHEDNTRFGTLNCVDSSASSASELMWRIMTLAGWPITAEVAECLYVGITADTGGFMFDNTTEATHRVAADLLSRGVKPSRVDSLLRQTRSLAGMHLWGAALGRITCWGEDSQFAMSWLTRSDFNTIGAIAADTEMLVNQLLLIRGVRFAVLMTEEESGTGTKISFRSKEGTVAAATVARSLGGGGHPRAAGANLATPLEETMQTVRKAVESAYAEWASADR